MKWILRNALLLPVLVLSITSCSDDSEDAVLPGRWQGTEAVAEFQPEGSPVSVYEESIPDFNPVIEFRDDGTVTVEDDGTTTNGTWTYSDGNQKIVANVDLQNEFLGASETFTIDQLTANTLVLDYEKEGDFNIPDFGEVSGKLTLTLNFNRMN